MPSAIDLHKLTLRVPLFAELDEDDLRYVLRAAQPLEFAPGALMVRQGQSADSALFMGRGRARVFNLLPGGGESVVGELGPGSVLGEMALLDSGVRSASVMASEPTACLSMSRDAFRMLIAQGNRAVLAINHRITLALCQRLRELNGKILARAVPEHLAPAVPNRPHQWRPCAFDYAAFLSLLPALRHFSADEMAVLLLATQAFDLPRGALLFEAGAACDACYVVVRGVGGLEAIIPNETIITSTVVNHSFTDRKVRVFKFATGRLSRTFDESLEAANELQRGDSGEERCCQ